MVTTVSTTSAPARPSAARTAALLLAGIVVAGLATSIIAFAASALGADGFPPLMPAVYLPFVALGIVAAHIGWRVIRSRAAHPARVLRVLVPVLLVLSWIPDVVLLATGFIPGTTVTGGIALMLMHPVVVAVAVAVSQRIAPVTR